MRKTFRRLLKPINLLTLLVGLVAIIFANLNQYDGFGFINFNASTKSALFSYSHMLVGILILIMGLRLSIEYKAWLGGFYITLLVAYGFFVYVFPGWSLFGQAQEQNIWYFLTIFFGIPILIIFYYISRWFLQKNH